MAEAMAVETVVEAYWQLRHYWTRLRYPVKTQGGWTDVDVLAYRPDSQHLVIAESKVRGPKNLVRAYTSNTRKEYGQFLPFDSDHFDYCGFLRNIPLVIKDGEVFDRFDRMVQKLTIQLVSNCFVAKSVKSNALAEIRQQVCRYIPKGIDVEPQIDTTLDLLVEIAKLEASSGQGRRYGHPVIDILREINRYLNPRIAFAGRGRAANDPVKHEIAATLSRLLRATSTSVDTQRQSRRSPPRPTHFGIYSYKNDVRLAAVAIDNHGRLVPPPSKLPAGIRQWFNALRTSGIDSRQGCSLSGGPDFAHIRSTHPRFWEIVMRDAWHRDYFIRADAP